MSSTVLNSPPTGLDQSPGSPQPAQESSQGPKQAERKKRTRNGCLNCSRRRRKCDEAKPTCTGCKRRGDNCQWRMLGSFRDANIKVLEPDHPSMSQSVAAGKPKRQSRFKILNAQPNPPRTRGSAKRQSGAHGRSASPTCDNDGPFTFAAAEDEHSIPDAEIVPSLSPPLSGDASSHVSQIPSQASPHHDGHRDVTRVDPGQANNHSQYPQSTQCDLQPTSIPDHGSPHAYINSSPEYMIEDLSALRNLTQGPQFHSSVADSYQTVPSPLFDHSVFSDPADFTNDVFLPGSAYEALHTALRNRQLWTARPDVPSRRSSRGSVPQVHTPTAYSDSESFTRGGRKPRPSRTGRYFELSPEREHALWQNYLDEICSWLDMFDNDRHFASTFPQMAKTSPHLRYSILALSARQLERQQNEKSQSESLSLYQEAIHLLLPELENKTTPVIASCVILCVLEMLSCNPKEWRRHLDGCAFLIQAAGINGFSGKEEQALFWCFARMDVCGGLISEEETIIPIHNWRPSGMSCVEASQMFLSSAKTNFDFFTNYTVYLCAQTLGVLFGTKSPHPCSSCQSMADEDGNSYVHQWQEVFGHAEQWYENRPSQMKPIFTIATTSHSGRNQPFPTVLYGNGDAISGNQLYHTCALLLLQQKPKTLVLSRKPKSVLWHARQICAISASNAHHGCWTNALQPLWIAGKAMSHYSEHAAIVETLVRIERETGWATAWRVEDLKEFWGDYDNDDEYDVDMEEL